MPPPPPSPSTRTLLSSILAQLSAIPTDTTPTSTDAPITTTTLTPSTHPLILTLYCLLPTHLLPALDLLDRKLITRLPRQFCVYYVSSPTSPNRYEVRPGAAWHCTCSAFMFAAFNTHDTDDGEDPNENVYEEAGEGEGGVWGGIAATAPICKHLLACVLAEHCETIFSGMVREEEGSEEEDVRAGLAALGDV